MIDVNLLNLFETCSRMASRCRSPLAVRAGIGFRSISDCPKDDLGTQRTRAHRATVFILPLIALRPPRSAPLIAPSPIPPESVTHSQPAAVSPPGFLNVDWRSGFADSNP